MAQIHELFNDVTDFDDLLEAAEANASSDFEMDFTSSLRTRYVQYAVETYLSEKQLKVLRRIAGEEG